jgi:hypothetical protein
MLCAALGLHLKATTRRPMEGSRGDANMHDATHHHIAMFNNVDMSLKAALLGFTGGMSNTSGREPHMFRHAAIFSYPHSRWQACFMS